MMDYFEVITDAVTGQQTLRPYTEEEVAEHQRFSYEVAEKAIRFERNSLLVACDWTQLPDAPVDQTAWAVYRQALRDITDQEGFPSSVVWPVPPT